MGRRAYPMSPRPRIAAGLLASITGAVPPRLQKKLDENPKVADSWTWSEQGDQVVVTTDKGERVLLSPGAGAIEEPQQIACTCLLSPRCLHILAVATRSLPHPPESAVSPLIPLLWVLLTGSTRSHQVAARSTLRRPQRQGLLAGSIHDKRPAVASRGGFMLPGLTDHDDNDCADSS